MQQTAIEGAPPLLMRMHIRCTYLTLQRHIHQQLMTFFLLEAALAPCVSLCQQLHQQADWRKAVHDLAKAC